MTKVRTYRIDVDDNARVWDAIVIANDWCMTSQHLWTAASLDNGTNPWNVPILDNNWKLPNSSMPSSVMKVCVYDPNWKWADVYDYCNFDNTPEIPVVNDPQVTFRQGGVTMWTISLNQAWDTTIDLMTGWVSAGEWIDINNWEVSVKFDWASIVLDNNSNLSVCDYDTIKAGAAAWATAVQTNDLATVAMSGSYTDLINKPEIPSAQIQSDWEQTNTNLPDYIKNKPTIGNATITLQKNGNNIDCFELNQTANKNINLVLSKWDVGLWNVDNTSDVDKPVSSAVQCALDWKQDNISDLNTIRSNASSGKCASDTIAWYWNVVSCDASDFATAAQWAKADTAIQAADLSQVATSWQYCDLNWTPLLCNVATTWCYDDLSWIPNFCAVATSWQYCDLSWAPNLCTVATSWQYCDLSWTPTIPWVIDDVCSTCTNQALSANQGRVLNDRINTLEARGRFLSNWNASTWLPVTNPEELPYNYSRGDYFDVTVVWSTNYRPNWTSYTWVASTTVETEDLAVWDTYVFDWTNWLLQLNHNITTTFASISWDPYDNSCLSSALNNKQDNLTAWQWIDITNNTIKTTLNFWTSTSAAACKIKCVSIPEITELCVGQTIKVMPTITSTACDWCLKLNDFDSYPIRYMNAALTSTTDWYVWWANCPVEFLFDWTYWQVASKSYDTNSTYTLNQLIDAGKHKVWIWAYAVTRYSLVMEKPDFTWEKITDPTKNYTTGTKTVNTRWFLLNHIRYYNTTTNLANGAYAATNTFVNQAASVDLRYSTNCWGTTTWTSWDYMYLVWTMNNWLFYLDTTQWWTTQLPSTKDNKLYIRIWIVLTDASYTISLLADRPIFYYDWWIKEYTQAWANALQSWDNISLLNNDAWYTTCTWTVTDWDLASYAKCCDLKAVATSGKYCDLTGTPTYAAVATSWLYCDLSWKPTIPTKVSDLSNDCNYIDKDVNNLTNYTPSSSLSVVATSWAYCDLTGIPEFSCVAMSGCYDDLAGKPNLWVYQCVCNMVCSLSWADHNHYPTAKTVADALSCAWAWDMLSTVYDPNNCASDAFNYNNFYNKPNLATVATSWKYCDLSWLPTIPATLTSWCAINISSNKINVQYDNDTIKKNSWNCLYANLSWLATTEELSEGLSCKADISSLCTVATSWKYCDLSWLPTIPTNNNQLTNWCWYTTCTWTVVASDLNPYAKSCDLKTVATSGQYCDLSWLPTIPTDNCQLANWCWYITSAAVNTKTFCLSWTSDLTTAQAAYNWYKAWNTPIIQCGSYTYILEWVSSNSVKFVSTNQNWWTQWNSRTTAATSAITLCKSSDTINCITTSSVYSHNFLETDRNYSTPYTPQYDWSPATKKYVDDHVWSQWWCITGTLSSQTDLSNVLNCKAECSDIPTDNCQLANGCWYLTCASLAPVATSGKYCDLTWTPNLCAVATSWKYCDLTGSPSLCTVATSWKYCDLSWTPTIPTDNCQLANWCWYVTSASLDTRTFKLTNASDTTNATAALTYINWWGNAIILYNNVAYTLNSKTSSQLVFKWPSTISAWTSYTTINQPTLTFTVSWASVTAITSANASLWKYLEVDRNYWTPLTPSYNGSPTSKKYVDDCLTCKANTSSLCAVATSGKYCDLTWLPTIPTNNNQLTNGCWYTTCTGTLTNWSLVTINGCCLVWSWNICIQWGVTSVSYTHLTVTVSEFCPSSSWSCGQVLQKTNNWYDWATISLDAWDMCYSDFNWSTKSWASVTLDLNNTITPSSNFIVNKPSTIKEWQTYILRVSSWATVYTMTLGTWINNPWWEDLTLTANWIDQFVFLATSSSTLELQKADSNENVFVTQQQYDNLPASKCTDWKTYFIYEVE